MTATRFADWLSQLNKKMTRQNRRVTMIINNCPTQPKLTFYLIWSWLHYHPNVVVRHSAWIREWSTHLSCITRKRVN